MKKNVGAAISALALSVIGFHVAAQPPVGGDYVFTRDISLGAPNFWDYVTYDPFGKRIYAAHVDRITVIDAASGKKLGEVGPLHDAHGVAIVPDLNKGYADSGEDGVLKVFDLNGLQITKVIKVDADADGVVFDSKTRSVLVVAGDSKSLTVVRVSDDTVTKTIKLPGKPEFLAVDGHGKTFVNITDLNSIAKVDIASGDVEANWPLDNCTAPHGIAYDSRTNRLFSGCANGRLAVLDAATGKSLANLPIGGRSDGIVVDETRGRVFSSNGDGTLTVIVEAPGGAIGVQRTVPTFFGGRNMAIDAVSGELFVAHGNMTITSPMQNLLQLRFGWDGLNLATFRPND